MRGTRFGVAEVHECSVLLLLRMMPTLFVDTHAPLDVLYDAANYRIRAVTQVLENMSMRGSVECESFILSDFALLCAIPLRDGCDVLDVIGRRFRARPSD